MRLIHDIVALLVSGTRAVPRSRGGQAMVEYTIIAGMMLATVGILAVFMYTFKGHSGRILDLVASEYP